MPIASELHIVVPGICGPLAEVTALDNSSAVKHWVNVLSKAHCQPSSSTFTDVITSLFDLAIEGDFPSAALTMLALNDHQNSTHYMFADPVHLQADMDQALLTSSEDLAISDHEAEVFCEMLNDHFNQDGLHFIKLNKNQWVISSKENIKLNTTPLTDSIGRNINFILPKGEASGYWKLKLTEAQMLMYMHEINNSRESARQQSINSIWLHGSGSLPDFEGCNIDSICSNASLFKGLASHVKCDYRSLLDTPASYMNSIAGIRVNDNSHAINVLHLSDLEHLVNYSDVRLWSTKLEDVLNTWIYPLLKMSCNHSKVTLYPCNGKKYQFSKYDAFKFWRQGDLSQHISSY